MTSVTTDPRHVILEPVVSEKAYNLIQFDKYTFKVHPKAHKTQVRQAIELLFGVHVVAVKIVNVPGKPKRRGQVAGLPPRLQEGDHPAARRRFDRALRGGALMGVRQFKPTSPGSSLHDDLGLRRGHARQAGEEPARPGQAPRRPQQHRPHHDAPPGRRPQAPLPHHRLQAAQGRRAGQGGRRSSTTPTARRASRCCTTSTAHKAYILAPARLERRRDACSRARTPTSRSATACRSRRSRPARSCTPSSCARARARAWCARPARAPSWSPARRGARCCACPPASSAASPRPAARRSARVSNATHQNQSSGKAGRSRWLGKRPSVRGTAMNPVDHPHGGGEGKNKGSHPVTPWGKITLGRRTRDPKKASSRDIVRGRKRGKGRS